MTKAKLREWRSLKLEKDDLERRVASLKYGPGGVRLDGMPRSGKISNPTCSEAIDHTELIELYEEKSAELDKVLLELETAIQCLEPRERTLIRLYYADGLTWEEVCVTMHYEWAQTHRIHKAALEKLKDV